MRVSALAFACHSKACAPPPVGSGGSSGRGGGWPKDMGTPMHMRSDEAVQYSVRNTPIGRKQKFLHQAALEEATKRGLLFPHITAAEARGDSRPVSAAEFQALAQRGKEKLDRLKANSSPTKGLDDNWDAVKSSAYGEARQSWGGATIDAHTGKALPQGANKYALTIKDKGVETVSVHEGASEAEFNQAMNTARERFGPILEREGSHLGVFHDDENHRIDIDPVLVVESLDDVHTMGAATRAIGGAYNFADGNGYWPPHVQE